MDGETINYSRRKSLGSYHLEDQEGNSYNIKMDLREIGCEVGSLEMCPMPGIGICWF
jgi:hypothetical protein